MKSLKHEARFFITHSDAALMIEPGHCMLNHDPKDAQSRTMGVVHGLCQERPDLARSHRVDVGLPAIASVAQITAGAKTRTTTCARDGGNRVQQCYRLPSVQNVCRCGLDSQRQAVPINDYVPFAAIFRPVCRIGAGVRPPKAARTEALSTTARENSSFPFLPKRRSKTLWSRVQTPDFVQAFILRQQVGPLGASSAGIAFHADPVRRTNRMPTRQSLSSARGRPPLGRGGAGGSKRDTSAHNLSDTHSRAIGVPP